MHLLWRMVPSAVHRQQAVCEARAASARVFGCALPLLLRNPDAIRPWRHVLDAPARLCGAGRDEQASAAAFNFSPDAREERSMGGVASRTRPNPPSNGDAILSCD